MSPNAYERFRTILIMNLCQVLDADLMPDVIEAFDISLQGFEISESQTAIIPAVEGNADILKAYLASKSVAGASNGTLKQYRYKLVDFFRRTGKGFADITSYDIRMYLAYFKTSRKASNSYLDQIRLTINTFYTWLVDNDYIPKNPCRTVEKIRYQQKKRIPLTSIELETVRLNTVTPREKSMIDFLYSTGLRATECADVRLSDINWQERSVLVRHGKGDKERTVFFNAEAEASMKCYLDARKDSTDALFVRSRKPYTQLSTAAIENIIKKVARRTEIRIFPHKLRHTFATHSIRSGMPLEVLQMLLGHAKPETTLIYAHMDNSDAKHEHQRIYA